MRAFMWASMARAFEKDDFGGGRGNRRWVATWRWQGRAFTVREVAGRLRVSTATVYRMCERGELGHVRVSNAIRVPEAAVAALINCSRG